MSHSSHRKTQFLVLPSTHEQSSKTLSLQPPPGNLHACLSNSTIYPTTRHIKLNRAEHGLLVQPSDPRSFILLLSLLLFLPELPFPLSLRLCDRVGRWGSARILIWVDVFAAEKAGDDDANTEDTQEDVEGDGAG